ncbi:hypothetical protein Tco_1523657 [Tanacetum coccineum]
MNDTSLMEKVDSNTTPDSSDMCNNEFKDNQNADDHEDEGVVLANLITNLKLDIDEKKDSKAIKVFERNCWKKHVVDEFCAPTAKDMIVLVETCLMPLAIKTQNDSFKFVHEFKQEMFADLQYVQSLEKEINELKFNEADFSNIYDLLLQECVSKDVMCSYLHSLFDFDTYTELQCLYHHKIEECKCLAEKLSKQTKTVSKEVYNEVS